MNEYPRIDSLNTLINGLRLKALRGEPISLEEYKNGITQIRAVYAARKTAKAAGEKPVRATKTKAKTTSVSLDDLL